MTSNLLKDYTLSDNRIYCFFKNSTAKDAAEKWHNMENLFYAVTKWETEPRKVIFKLTK